MPASIPDRYKLELRLGRDGDIEEWLATDTSLERPVLVRSLGPESTEERRSEFVEAVGQAAKVAHPHLSKVYVVERVDGGAYSASEWTGGATLEDRIEAGRPIDLDEFLPNASGLAGALAALHDSGACHGDIDLGAISFSIAHPAKLGAFGRPRRGGVEGDVRALAAVLENAVTGQPPGGPPPSERIDGFPRSIDRILRQGQSGDLSASELEKVLVAAPTPRAPQPEAKGTSRRLLLAATVLVLLAIGLVALGRVFTGGGPILPGPPATTTPNTVVTVIPTSTLADLTVLIEEVASYDPFGEGGENDELLPNLIDDNLETSWRTEQYQAPLADLKQGVGVRFALSGTPGRINLEGFSPGTVFELLWAEAVRPLPDDWERLAGARAPSGSLSIGLPPRDDGHWLIWLTGLPEQSDGSFQSTLAEVRFAP